MRLVIPNLPKGVYFNQNGLTFDLADHDTKMMLKAAFYQMAVLDRETMLQDAEIASIDPSVTSLLTNIFKESK